MEDHKTLFKSQATVLSPRNHNKINRERQRVARTKKREESYQRNRCMDVSRSATPEELPQTAAANAEQENKKPEMLAANKPTVELRKDQYLQRYIKWKAERRKDAPLVRRQQQEQPAVFVPPKRRSIYVVLDPKTGKAAEIKRLPEEQQLKLDQVPVRKSNVAAVQPAKQLAAKTALKPAREATVAAVKFATGAAAVAKPTVGATAGVKPKPAVTTVKAPAVARKPALPMPSAAKPAQAAIAAQKPTTIARKPLLISAAARTAATTPAAASKPKPVASLRKPPVVATAAPKANRPNNLMTQPFDKPITAAKIVKPIRGGAAAKFKSSTTQKCSKSQVKSELSRPMKITKAVPGNSKQKLLQKMPNLKKELLKIATEEPLPETPIDLANIENPFQAQATSTQCKSHNCSQDLLEVYRDLTKLSPVVSATENAKSTNCSAKRQLIPENKSTENKSKSKFNFVRYSEGHELLESPTAAAEEEEELVTMLPAAMDEDKTVTNGTQQTVVAAATVVDGPETPPQRSNDRPNYLSPFVSVSRGKVNSQTERKKRDSMYLQDEQGGNGQKQPETPVAVRRTLDAVKYFRLQLDNEIKRLGVLCNEWTAYCGENVELLTETGGKDMIDAAIGQTNLLSSKKLQQFASLIDRCEAGATGIGLRANDGSESTKPVLADDLQGWWDMMRLQGDNVDKRFDNLARWKANNWQDPDAVEKPKLKAKPAKTKVKQPTKAKASSSLQSFLLKAKAEKRRQQAQEQQAQQQQLEQLTTPTRRTIVVRDRKSFSPARTVLRLSMGGTASGGRSSLAGNGLLKSAIIAAAEQKARQPATPPAAVGTGAAPQMTPRMSILKTPGTAKKREAGQRGVMFSAKKKVRRFEFAVEEGNLSGADDDDDKDVRDGLKLGIDKLEDCEEDMSLEKSNSSESSQQAALAATPDNPNILRTCQLRNRKVKIRPSSEFM